jgi:hypothetical protein
VITFQGITADMDLWVDDHAHALQGLQGLQGLHQIYQFIDAQADMIKGV